MSKIVDVGSKSEYPANVLSNFFPNYFVFDRIACHSAEGLLQAFKNSDFEEQKKMCKLVGKEAKKRGSLNNESWQKDQTLWWRGRAYKRESLEYQILLDRLFRALAKNSDFWKALLATGDAILIHSIGKKDPKETVLTEKEFCDRLVENRESLKIKYPAGLLLNRVANAY